MIHFNGNKLFRAVANYIKERWYRGFKSGTLAENGLKKSVLNEIFIKSA